MNILGYKRSRIWTFSVTNEFSILNISVMILSVIYGDHILERYSSNSDCLDRKTFYWHLWKRSQEKFVAIFHRKYDFLIYVTDLCINIHFD